MKKYIVSIVVLVAFAAYVWWHNHPDDEAMSISPPITTPINQSPSATTTESNSSSSSPPTPSSTYKDGSYTSAAEDAFYGNVQIKVVITGGKITDVNFLQYPNDRRTSVEINNQAMPLLRQEAIQAQSAQVDGVSGASATSQAFQLALSSALSAAKQ